MAERPIRIQLSRAKGWRMPPNTVSVARPGKWGNPYRIGETLLIYGGEEVVEVVSAATAEQVVVAYRFAVEPYRPKAIAELRGKNLACWCKLGTPCHADVLLELANP